VEVGDGDREALLLGRIEIERKEETTNDEWSHIVVPIRMNLRILI
jgi:hypothetical protein